MKTGFDASVPARKPKTQIGRALSEFTSRSATQAIEEVEDTGRALEPDAPDEAAAPVVSQPAPAPRAPQRQRSESGGSARDVLALRPDSSSVSTGWERVAALRERLAQTAQPRPTAIEPQHTAAAVGKLIEELRARLETALRERSETARALEETRTALARAETDLERERRARADIEARADERGQVAAQAVAEAESLASERDLVLNELAERRRFEDAQAALLADVETALNRRDAEIAAASREASEVREMLELRVAEIADLETRLQAEAAERARVEARCQQLESDNAALAEAADALEAIKAMIGPQR